MPGLYDPSGGLILTVPSVPAAGYQLCVLGGLTYRYNPTKSKNPRKRALAVETTFGGAVYTDFGYSDSDRRIEQTWDHMEASFFNALDALQSPGTLAYVDEFGQPWTVYLASLDYDGYTPVADVYLAVKLTLAVVSAG